MNTIVPQKQVCTTYRSKLYNYFEGKGANLIFNRKSLIEIGGKTCKYVYLIKEGYVQQYFIDSNGNTKFLLILTKGDLFGEITLFQQDEDKVNTQAHSNVILERIPANLFMKLANQNPKIYYYISLMLSNKARIFMAQIQDSSFHDTISRLKHLLIRLSHQHGASTPDGIKILPYFTHNDLAQLVSSTRSTISKKMKILEQNGFIYKDGNHIVVSNTIIKKT